MAALAKIPEMQVMSVLASQQQLGIDTVLHHVRRAPFAGDGNVVAKVPSEIVAELLRTALDFPSTEWFEGVVIEGKYTSRAVSARRAERAQVNAVRSAVHRVRPAVSGAIVDRFWFDHLHDLWVLRMRFR